MLDTVRTYTNSPIVVVVRTYLAQGGNLNLNNILVTNLGRKYPGWVVNKEIWKDSKK